MCTFNHDRTAAKQANIYNNAAMAMNVQMLVCVALAVVYLPILKKCIYFVSRSESSHLISIGDRRLPVKQTFFPAFQWVNQGEMPPVRD